MLKISNNLPEVCWKSPDALAHGTKQRRGGVPRLGVISGTLTLASCSYEVAARRKESSTGHGGDTGGKNSLAWAGGKERRCAPAAGLEGVKLCTGRLSAGGDEEQTHQDLLQRPAMLQSCVMPAPTPRSEAARSRAPLSITTSLSEGAPRPGTESAAQKAGEEAPRAGSQQHLRAPGLSSAP